MPLFLVLTGCLSNEPSEDEMREAFIESALPYAKKSFIGGGEGNFLVAGMAKSMTVDVRNFQKVSCDEINDITFSCEIYAEIKMNLPKESSNLLTLFGGGTALDWIQVSQAVEFINIKNSWKVRNPNY